MARESKGLSQPKIPRLKSKAFYSITEKQLHQVVNGLNTGKRNKRMKERRERKREKERDLKRGREGEGEYE